jgi:anti-sigma factor RsiW
VSCPGMPDLLHGYADGELYLVHALQVEQHLQACPDCSRELAEIRALKSALQARLPRFSATSDLATRLRSSLRRADRLARPLWRRRWLYAVAASLALAVGLSGALQLRPRPARDRLIQEVIAGHVRSQQLATHLLDVESSDRHKVKPWFRDKLDFSPTVRNLSEQGFILAGGRLDYVNGRPVAALVYRRRLHVINLLVWPADRDEEGPLSSSRQGYNVIHWRRDGMSWWAISDLNSPELTEFARLQGME